MVSFMAGSELGYMLVIGIVIISAYVRNEICIGNAFMYINTTYSSVGVIRPMYIVIASFTVLVSSCAILLRKFSKIDIL